MANDFKHGLVTNFSLPRDRYRVQETHKSYDDGKWYCHFCGKAFVSEYFLDLHFDNRHTEQLSQDNAICLADVCEIFRCDIISQKVKADYWDVALCLEDDMKSLHQRCAFMVSSCVPSDLTENETRWLTDVTVQELCSYLTCSKYWDVPFDSDRQDSMAAFYIVLTVFVLFGIIIYYCLCFTYFYTDTFVDAVAYDPMPFTKHPIKPYNPDLRNRARLFPESHPD